MVLLISLIGVLTAKAEFPRKTIEVNIPFAPKGVSHSVVQRVNDAIQRDNLSPKPFTIRNLPGAGGTIGSRRVKSAPPDGYKILALHDAILTAKHAPFSSIEYGPEAFEPIAATGLSTWIVCVSADTTWLSLNTLLEAAAESPDGITFGVSQGAPSHFVALRLQNLREGARFKLVNTKSLQERASYMALEKSAPSKISVSVFPISEYETYRRRRDLPSGIKAIAYLGEERHPRLLSIPTAKEDGFDLVSGLTHFWWAPKGTPPARVTALADILEKAMDNSDLHEEFKELGIDPLFLRGEALHQRITDLEARVATTDLSNEREPVRLRLGLILLFVVFALGALLFLRRAKANSHPALPNSKAVLLIFAALVFYTVLLGLGAIPYWLITALFICGLGVWIAHGPKERKTALGLGLGIAVALHLIFQIAFILDLP